MSLAVLFDLSNAKQLTALTCFSNLEQPQQTLPNAQQAHGTWERVASTHTSEKEQKGQTLKARVGRPEIRWRRSTKTTIQRSQALVVLLLKGPCKT